MNENQFYEQVANFLKSLNQLLQQHSVTFEPQWDIDHLCYRTSTDERYAALKMSFSSFAQFLVESEVNGRLIATYQLAKPVEFLGRQIGLVELPAPKKSKTTPEGFEHIEVVCDIPFAEIEKRYPALKFDKKGLSKEFNKELELELGDLNVKFHHLSLRSVVELESNEKVWGALKNSQVLKVLGEFDPLVAGTFPLGIHTKRSDLDIIVLGRDLNVIRDLIKAQKSWGPIEFKRHRTNDLESLTAKFTFEDVPFEIFSQSKETVKQVAYKHFLIEERLLKYKGPEFAERIRDLRRQGLKTEPAFAVALGLDDDPYDALLLLENLTPQSLLQDQLGSV